FLMVGPVHYWMKRTFTRRIAKLEPTPGRRVAVAGVKMTARLLSGLVGGFAVLATARAVGLLGPEGEAVARAIWFALIAFLLVEGFTGGLFSPAAPGWRIADIEAVRGRRASALLLAIVIVFGAKSVFSAIAAAAHADAALLTLFDGVSAVLIGALLLLLCRRSLWKHEPAPAADAGGPAQLGAAPAEEGEDAPVDPWPLVRRAGRVLAIVIIGAALTGYVALADFAASRFYYLALILAVAWFARAALKEAGAFAERRLRAERAQKQPDEDKNIARFWIGAGVDLILLAAITPVILVLVGLGWQSVRDMVMRAFIGFRVGGVTISLADMFWAIAVFFLILTGTRIVQSWLQRGPFAHSRLDIGVQNSLTTLLGYVGLLIAVITGVTALGFNLANLALIAGALGVGIGFGLQGIVNNFVSGLILLFERPVKVGDWIVTASGEGTVKKISVRSTEIETFDRATIIVPNSELISQTVTNWTHKDKIGRVTVSVGVSYGSDPEQVRDILLKCARDHRLVVRYPEPFVVWKDFGASSLDFEVRCYLRDILDGLTVRTELRLAIFKAFKEAGIEIPFPQRDLHIKSMPNGAAAPTPRPAEKAAEPPPAPSETEIAEDE
ncbi:MAG: mechanosensitive ion channel family protein, partial [Amphiplicatus sp.]